jgi:two-component SAPR family response regulator
MTGLELAGAARDIRPDLPVLLATGYAELPTGSSTDLPRLAKPFRQDQLAREIAKALGSADNPGAARSSCVRAGGAA